MDFNGIKKIFLNTEEVGLLDAPSRSILFLNGDELIFLNGSVIYTEGDQLDDTFCILLQGELAIEQKGKITGTIKHNRIFGESAYFTSQQLRRATIRVLSKQAGVFQIKCTPEQIQSLAFSPMKQLLGVQAWQRFVNDSQNST